MTVPYLSSLPVGGVGVTRYFYDPGNGWPTSFCPFISWSHYELL